MSQITQTKIINKIAQRTKFNPDGIRIDELSKSLRIGLNFILDEILKLENKSLVILLSDMKVKLAPLYYTQNFYLNLRKNKNDSKQ